MLRYHDASSPATHPLPIRLSRPRLQRLYMRFNQPPPGSIYESIRHFEDSLDEHLSFGESLPAVVYSADPLIISAYSDDIDCSALLSFPERVHRLHRPLQRGDRLITINTYVPRSDDQAPLASDLWYGENGYFCFLNFNPVIADFFTEDVEVLEERKKAITEPVWQRCLDFGDTYRQRNQGRTRDGDPMFSFVAASG